LSLPVATAGFTVPPTTAGCTGTAAVRALAATGFTIMAPHMSVAINDFLIPILRILISIVDPILG
jgi:hypothetical protein